MRRLLDINVLLADLADRHGCKLATLDEQIKHPAAVIVR